MGYTHYFEQNKEVEPAAWKAICDDFRKLLASALLTTPLPIQREEHESSPPLIDDGFIVFNGRGSQAHEPMVLERNGRGFHFCKTQRKAYDSAVTALLCLANFHAPGVWDITSDGLRSDWQEGLLLAKLVQPTCDIPVMVMW